MSPQLWPGGRQPASAPYRRRGGRRMLYGAAVVAALIALPTTAAVVIVICGLVAAAGRRALRDRGLLGRGRPGGASLLGAEGEGVRIGTDLRTGEAVSVADRALAAHGLVVGASGAGKTTTLLSIASHQIAKQRPVIVVDLKGSPSFARSLHAAAARAGRGVTVWTLDGGSVWNPLKYGNATELKDKLIATEHFTEPHYKRAAERYLQMAIQVLHELEPGRSTSLDEVVRLLEPQRLAAVAGALPKRRANAVRDYVRSLAPDQLSAVRGLASRLAIITESHTGPFLDRSCGTLPELDLRGALEGGNVVLLSLNSSSYGQLAGQIGTMAVQDLVAAAGARLKSDGHAPQATVVIDEFSALDSGNVLALLSRGRESGVGVVLATQELSDLDRVAPGFRQQVIGNTAVKIAHRQDVPDSAAAVSELAGTFKDWEYTLTQRDGGRGRGGYGSTVRVVDRPIVEPAEAQTMPTGAAVVHTKVPYAETHVTQVRRSDNDRRRDERSPER